MSGGRDHDDEQHEHVEHHEHEHEHVEFYDQYVEHDDEYINLYYDGADIILFDHDDRSADINKYDDPGATHYFGDGCPDDHGRADHPSAIDYDRYYESGEHYHAVSDLRPSDGEHHDDPAAAHDHHDHHGSDDSRGDAASDALISEA